jgi:hypothetical protein
MKIFQDTQDYSPQVREIIRQYADEIATGAIVMRTPVSDLAKLGIKIISLGNFDNDIYHLFLEVYFESGKSLLIEKNAVINMVPAPKVRTGSAMEKVGNWHNISFQNLLDGARKVLGNKYFTYSASSNNCQDFIMAILRGSNLGTTENYKFIKQDTRSMFRDLKITKKIVKNVTRLGGIVDRLINGVGIENKISRNNIMPRMKGCSVEGEPVMQAGGSLPAMARALERKKQKKMEKMAEETAEGMGLYAGRGLYAGMGVVHHHHYYEGGNVGDFFKKAGKVVAKEVVSKALPYAASAVGAKVGMLGGPAGALAGATLGHKLGSLGSDELNKTIGEGLYAGMGVRKGRFPKGSQEAKEYMARIRAMRK